MQRKQHQLVSELIAGNTELVDVTVTLKLVFRSHLILSLARLQTVLKFLVVFFRIILLKMVWNVECSRHSRANTTVLCRCYTDTHRQLLALKRAACNDPLLWTWSEPVAWGTRWMVVSLLCGKRPLHGGSRWMLVGLLCGSFERWFAILLVRYAWSTRCMGSPLDACRFSAVAERNAGSPLVELLVDLAFTCCECRCDCVWCLLTGAYLYSSRERGGARLASQ
jgi:hypothetical protein